MNTIFVAIASFLDYEIKYTLLDVIHKAKYPNNLKIAVVLQYDENDGTDEKCIDDLQKLYSITIEKHYWKNSHGGCWARNLAQQYYNKEKYSLQIDSHTRMIMHWDEMLIKNLDNLKKISDKPIISYLSPSYFRNDNLGIDYEFRNIDNLDYIEVPKAKFITDEYWINYGGYENQRHTEYKNINIPFLYGGFIFSEGCWIEEVEQDPLHYYTGEEFALMLRSYTKGYDVYLPDQILSWHRSHPKPNKKHYNTFPDEVQNGYHRKAMTRLKSLIDGDIPEKYALGKIRTLEDYKNFSGIDVINKKLLKKE
jgi:hypothetical protein